MKEKKIALLRYASLPMTDCFTTFHSVRNDALSIAYRHREEERRSDPNYLMKLSADKAGNLFALR